jgi:diacylglycerol kinase (ATP)
MPGQKRRGRLVASFEFAFQGIVALLRTQANARIHLAATIVVIAAGLFFAITRMEWCAIAAAIGLVWTAEGLNTAIECVVDLVSPEHHPLAGRAKDLGAGAVLIAAVIAVIIGALVFAPHLAALR